MQSEYLKQLWTLRFEKIRQNEEEAAANYQKILDQICVTDHDDAEIVALLEKLVREEKIHARLAQELIRICLEHYPELEVFYFEF